MEVITQNLAKIDLFLDAMKGDGFVSPEKAAMLAGWRIESIYNALNKGRLPKHKQGRRVYVQVEDLARLVFASN